MTTGLQEKHRKEAIPAMIEKFGYKNIMEVPRLEKIVINMGVGEAKDNQKILEATVNGLSMIAGQKPILIRAKKPVANFKIRESMALGYKVTLRRTRMYGFADKLMATTLPRVKDLRGVSSKAFDGRGDYSLGVKEQLIFPEIEYDKIGRVRGMDIIFVTTANTDEEARELLGPFGMPFAQQRGRKTVARKTTIEKWKKEPKYKTRVYTRCRICGGPHSVLRKFGICRICFREFTYKDQVPGYKKAS